MTAENTQNDLIKEFLAACGFQYGLAVFMTTDGKIATLDTCPGIVERVGLSELLHDGVRTEIRRINLNRLEQREKECADGTPK